MAHYGMQPTWNNQGIAHEKGDVEQSHHRFKEAVDQALRVRGSREFASRAAYERFLHDLVFKRNQTRAATFHLDSNVYSVPSRLIGTKVLIRVRAETLEGYVGTSSVFLLPRLVGKKQHRIDSHHLIWSLVRKPGAFAAYQYRDELFPTTTFRLVYDQLLSEWPKRAEREYVRILHLAATTSESEVETALILLRETKTLPTFVAVRDLVTVTPPQVVPQIPAPTLDLSPYDNLIPSRRTHV